MSRFQRTAVYFYYAIRKRSLTNVIPSPVFVEDKKTRPVTEKLSTSSAKAYRSYAYFQERTRVWKRSVGDDLHDQRIGLEILKYSKKLIAYLILATILGTALDWAYWHFIKPNLANISFVSSHFSSISIGDIQTGLTIYVGAVSALLGLIFALYAVGFQLTTDRYSEDVTSFMNEEPVSNYFFGLLIFTDIFSIITLVRLQLITTPPVFSFLLATVMVTLCLLGVVIFKKHYIESMKPVSVFRRIWQQNIRIFNIVTSESGYKTKSWSIVSGSRIRTKKLLNIFGSLYDDLINTKKFDDASYGPLIMGKILREYLDNKRFINNDRGWWAEQRFETPSGGDMSVESDMQNAYEIQGRGIYLTSSQDSDWFEKRSLEILKTMRDSACTQKDAIMISRASEGYRQILAGDREKNGDNDPTDILGAWQNQEFFAFDQGLTDFLELIDKAGFGDSSYSASILNDYFAIWITCVEKWDIKLAINVAEEFYSGDELNSSKKFLKNRSIPMESRKVLIGYWQMLELEQKLEGKIITPKAILIEELTVSIQEVLTKQSKSTLEKFLEHSNKTIDRLVEEKNNEYVGQFVKMQMMVVSRLQYDDQSDLANMFAPSISKNCRYLLLIGKEQIVELKLLDQCERGFFVGIMNNETALIRAYAKALVLVRQVIITDVTDENEVIKHSRQIMFWGAALFIVSELSSDVQVINEYVELLDKLYPNGSLPKMVTLLKDLKPADLIGWEVNRYSRWFLEISKKLKRELVEEPYRNTGEIGYSTHYVHTSEFIRSLSEWEYDISDRAIEAFSDWVTEWDRKNKEPAIQEILELLRKRGETNA